MVNANLTSDTPSSTYSGPQTATSIGITGSFPAFSSSTYGMCFYAAGEAAQAPLIPTVSGGIATVSVPASYFQNVPASDFASGSATVQFFVAPATQTCDPSVMYSNTVNFILNQYSFNLASNNEVPAGQAGFPLQVDSSNGALPMFSSSTYGLCFFTPYGTTSPLIPTTSGMVSSVNVPASYVQNITPANYATNYGTISSEIFVAQAGQTCDDTKAYSAIQYVYLEEPETYTFSFSALSQNNPALSATANPTLMQFQGNAYTTNPPAQAQFIYTVGGTAQPEVPGTTPYSDPNTLTSTVVAPPAGATDIEVTVCNVATYTYCGGFFDPTVYPLANSTSTLTATPNTLLTTQTTSLTAQFVPGTYSTPTNGAEGALSGLVTFTNGATTLGTAPLVLNTATATFNAGDGASIGNSFSGASLSSLTPFYTDFNHDGIPDVVILDSSMSTFHLMLGTVPRGDYIQVPDLPTSGTCSGTIISAAVGDLNKDGFPDLVFLCQVSAGMNQLTVALNEGGIITSSETVIATIAATHVAIGDINKDGSPDIVVSGQIGTIPASGAAIYGFNTYLGNGSGASFTAGPSTPSNYAYGTNLQLVDYDQDGYPDISIFSLYEGLPLGVALLRNDHTGAFGVSTANVAATSSATYVVAPLNTSTKYPSVLITDAANTRVGISANPGNGNFTAPAPTYTTLTAMTTTAWGDFTGDGNLDVAFYDGVNFSTANIKVYAGDGIGGLSATNFASGYVPNATLLEGMDQNADGYADVLVYTPPPSSGSAGNLTNYLTTGTTKATLPPVSLPAGTNTVTATTPGTVDMLGGAPTAQVTVTTPPTATITWATPAAITYGTLLSGTQLDATAANGQGQTVPGTFTYSPAAATLLTAGTQTLSVLFTPTDMVDYTSSTKTVTLTVNKATPSVSWTTPASIPYGTALSSTQLDATATGISGALPGTFTYTPAAGTVLGAGTQTLSVLFTPTDTTDYNAATKTVSLAVTKATPTLTWATPAGITYGTALSATQLDASATGAGGTALPGTFTYTPAAGTVLGTGTQTLSVLFTPTDTIDYSTATKTASLVVGKATPTVTWATPDPISYGTALSATQLNATASVPGTFTYTPAAGTVLGAGTQTLSVLFTPTDTTDYTNATQTVSLVVNQVTPTLTWPTPAGITYGTALSATQLDASATGVGGASLPGTFTYTPAAGTVLAAGTQTLSVLFTPTDTTDYTTATQTVSLVVSKASPTVTWATPAAITQGTPLSATQLNATATGVTGASLPGTFTYTPAAGTVLSAGTQTLSVLFTPTDTTDYTIATKTVSLVVGKATPTVTWAIPAPITYGTALSATQLNSTASVPGTFTYTPASGTVLSAGTQMLSVLFTPTDSTDYSTATQTVSLVVTQATPVITWPPLAPIANGTPLSSTQLDATATGVGGVTLPGTFTYTPPAGTVLPFGTQTLNVSFVPTNSTDYTNATGSNTITVMAPLGSTAPTTPVGSTSATQTVAVNFAVPGTLGSISVLTQGAPNLDFKQVSGGTCAVDTAYSSGQTCTVLYSFTPSVPGSRLGGISLASGDGTALGSSFLTGLGTGPQITFPSSSAPVQLIGGLVNAEGAAFDGSGNLFLADYSGAVYELPVAGGYTTVNSVGSGFQAAFGIAVDGFGNLFVSDTVAGKVDEVFAAGGYTAVSSIGSGISKPTGVAVDGSGNVYVTDLGLKSVRQFTAASGYTVANPIGSGFNYPAGVAVDGSGNVFVADRNLKEVLEVTAASGYTTVNSLGSGFTGPTGVTLDPAGNIYVADGTTIKEILAQGGYTTVNTLASPYDGPGIALDNAGNLVFTNGGNSVNRLNLATPPTLAFPATIFGTSSAAQTVTVTNQGNAPLFFTGLADTDSADFPLGESSCTATGQLASANSCILSVSFTPQSGMAVTGNINLTDNTLNATGSVQTIPLTGTGVAASKVITFPQPTSPIARNSIVTLGATASNGDPVTYSILSGTATLSGATITFTTAGTVTIAANSAATTTYAAAPQVTRTVQVQPSGVTITWIPNPATITYGTALSAAQLDATASVPGTFVYTPASGTVLGAGTQTLSVTFTPTDTTNYSVATQTVNITVGKATPTVTWAMPAGITQGTALSATQLNATASVPGTFVYTPPAGTVLGAGTQTLSVLFTPTDAADYNTVTQTVSIVVGKATPTVTWANPAAIVYGTALSATQLNATASVPGTFTYTPAAGTVLQPGTQTLSVLFTPTDATDYTTVTQTVSLVVNNPTTSGALSSSGNPSQFGQPITLSLAITPVASLSAAPTGTVTFFDGTKNVGTANLASNVATLSLATLTAGSHALTAVYSGDTNYAGSTSAVFTQTVTPAATVLAWTPSVSSIVYGTALSSAQLNATVSTAYASTVPGVFTYTPAAGSVLTAGSQTLRVTFMPTDTTDFLPVSGTATITVTQATPVLTWPTPAGLVVGSPLTSAQLDATAAGVTGAALPGTFVYTPAAGTPGDQRQPDAVGHVYRLRIPRTTRRPRRR